MIWSEAVERPYQRMQYEGPHRRNALHMASSEVTMFNLSMRAVSGARGWTRPMLT
jgi:hypothetical protein